MLTDRKKLALVLRNIAQNALSFTRTQVFIEVIFKQNPPTLVFLITDNGLGITNQAKKHIFKPFNNLEKKTNKTNKGMGLGLFVALNVTKRMNGVLKVKSIPGSRTCFKLAVPFLDLIKRTKTRKIAPLKQAKPKTSQVLLTVIEEEEKEN
jgi:signal transduction histidine kinase